MYMSLYRNVYIYIYMDMYMKERMSKHIFKRHGLTEAKKPTIVAKAARYSVLLCSALAFKGRMPAHYCCKSSE